MPGDNPRAMRVSFWNVAHHAGRAAELAAKDAVRDLHVTCVGENSARIERVTDISLPRLLIHDNPPVFGTAAAILVSLRHHNQRAELPAIRHLDDHFRLGVAAL